MIITIDGPSGSGKSTVAKRVAEALQFVYFDTGAMYRSVTYSVLKADIDPHDSDLLEQFLSSFQFRIELVDGHKHYFVGEEEITKSIRSPLINKNVSWVAAIPTLRRHLVNIQRNFVKDGVNAVFEGRDLGTVVFPKANHKFFLVADAPVRAKRRYEEMIQKDPSLKSSITLEEVLEDINKRDEHDSTQEYALEQHQQPLVVLPFLAWKQMASSQLESQTRN